MDLPALTRGLMAKMEVDLGTSLQWVATVHRNTEYPHVHVALRGITEDGQPLRMPRLYIQRGIRAHAEELATDQLGYRTALDAEEAQRREVGQKRYTSLDRIINRSNSDVNQVERPESFVVDLSKRPAKPEKHHLQSRLLFLESMGLAESAGSNRWNVRRDFETVLRGLQRSTDRQRTLASHSALLSDPRLPTCLTDLRKIESLEGRVLGHAEDEATGRSYMILEGTDHKVHFVYHTPDIEDARHRGKLKPNAFVQFRHQFSDNKPAVTINDLGDSEELLSQKHYIRTAALAAQKRAAIPVSNGWAGWLGRYDAALAEAAAEIQAKLAIPKQPSNSERNRG